MTSDPIANVVAPVSNHAGWVLRIVFAATFLFYGINKLTGLTGFADMMLGGNVLVAALVTFAELAAGIGILLGAFTNSLITRLAGIATVPVLLGAIFMAHLPNGFHFMAQPTDPTGAGGWNFQFVLLGIGLYYLLVGNSDLNKD